jgi:hypothetical protein
MLSFTQKFHVLQHDFSTPSRQDAGNLSVQTVFSIYTAGWLSKVCSGTDVYLYLYQVASWSWVHITLDKGSSSLDSRLYLVI